MSSHCIARMFLSINPKIRDASLSWVASPFSSHLLVVYWSYLWNKVVAFVRGFVFVLHFCWTCVNLTGFFKRCVQYYRQHSLKCIIILDHAIPYHIWTDKAFWSSRNVRNPCIKTMVTFSGWFQICVVAFINNIRYLSVVFALHVSIPLQVSVMGSSECESPKLQAPPTCTATSQLVNSWRFWLAGTSSWSTWLAAPPGPAHWVPVLMP